MATRTYDAHVQFIQRVYGEMAGDPVECEKLAVTPEKIEPEDLLTYATGQKMIVDHIVKTKVKRRIGYLVRGIDDILGQFVECTFYKERILTVVRAISEERLREILLIEHVQGNHVVMNEQCPMCIEVVEKEKRIKEEIDKQEHKRLMDKLINKFAVK